MERATDLKIAEALMGYEICTLQTPDGEQTVIKTPEENILTLAHVPSFSGNLFAGILALGKLSNVWTVGSDEEGHHATIWIIGVPFSAKSVEGLEPAIGAVVLAAVEAGHGVMADSSSAPTESDAKISSGSDDVLASEPCETAE